MNDPIKITNYYNKSIKINVFSFMCLIGAALLSFLLKNVFSSIILLLVLTFNALSMFNMLVATIIFLRWYKPKYYKLSIAMNSIFCVVLILIFIGFIIKNI